MSGLRTSHSRFGAAGHSQGGVYFVQPTSGEGSTGRRIVKYVRV